MSKRVGIIALLAESNTFIACPTTLEHFKQNLLVTGEEVRDQLSEAHHEVGGFFAGLAGAGAEAVPVFAARAMPYGVMTGKTFEALMVNLEAELRKHLPLDGVLVAPHGAAVSEHVRDADGYWLRLVRGLVGPDCPIIGTIDPHANLTAQMVDATDALVAYRTNPHIDQRDRGLEAARLMVATLEGRIRPRQAAAFPPLAINIERQQTDAPPCREIFAAAAQIRDARDVLSSSICLGFPYADVPEMGSAALVVADGKRDLAVGLADDLAATLWEMRQEFQPRLTSIDEALDQVQRLDAAGRLDRPACLLDMGDNVGGGSPADGTFLAQAIHHRLMAGAFVCLCDPQAVELSSRFGIGQRVELSVGGKSDDRHGTPLTATFTIIAQSAGRFQESQPRHGGVVNFDQGPTVVVRTDNGLTIMLTSRRMAPWSLEQLRHCGFDPQAFKILVAKGVHAPIAAYQEVCRELIRVNTPGVTSADLSGFDYQHRRRPLFPFEANMSWSPRGKEAVA